MTDPFKPVRDYIRQQLVARSLPSLAVAVIRDGAILWQEGFGWANREARRPATAHTPYSVASVSKPMTATALMTLARAGRIDLDRPANDYLGAAKLAGRAGDARKATVRAVANHSAGLPLHYQFFYEDEPAARPSMDQTIARYGNLVTPPGQRWEYSNLGYGVLDTIIERVSGLSFAEFMRREVFLPLGMTRSAIGVARGLESEAAARYGADQAPIPFYVTDHPGGSEVYASVHDMARFALFHLKAPLSDQKPILGEAEIDEMHRGCARSGPASAYGIGFQDERIEGVRVVSHTGGMGGVAANLRLFPDRGIATIAVANASDPLPFEVSERIAALIVPGWTAREPAAPARAPPFKPPKAWAGTWRGEMATYTGPAAFKLVVRPDGEAIARVGRQLTSLVNYPVLEDGLLRGAFLSTIATPDAQRYAHHVAFALSRAGNRLFGCATALAEPGPRVRNALSHWVELRRET